MVEKYYNEFEEIGCEVVCWIHLAWSRDPRRVLVNISDPADGTVTEPSLTRV
jgi:hypothetical protein